MTILSLLLITIACLFDYSKSKHFPLKESIIRRFAIKQSKGTGAVSILSYIIAFVISIWHFGGLTGTFFWILAMVLVFSCFVIIIPLYSSTKKNNHAS